MGIGAGKWVVSGLLDDDVSPVEKDFDFFFPNGLQREDLPKFSSCSLAAGNFESWGIKIGETTNGGGLGDRAVVDDGGDIYPKLLLTEPLFISCLYSPWEECE